MKIAHFADLHYSSSNLEEADRCFGFAVEESIRMGAKIAIIAGDSTDHRLDAHAPAYLALASRIKQLADHCPVLMIYGTLSHEPRGVLHMLGMIGAKHPIVVVDKIGMIALNDGEWMPYNEHLTPDLVITAIPTVNKAELASVLGVHNSAGEMGNHLADILKSFSGANAQLRERGVPTVLVSHGTVDGSLNEYGVAMSDLDHEFTLGTLYAANADAVMLGHIHMHQSWERRHNGIHQIAAYSGSIGRFHYGECDEKYFLMWNVCQDNLGFEAVVTPSRRMIDIDFDGVPDFEKLAAIADKCAGAYVRVRFSVDEEYAKTLDRNAIKEILACACEVKIEGTTLVVQRQRCSDISKLPSLQEKLLKWCEVSQTQPDGLLERLAILQAYEPEEIARNIIRNERQEVKEQADAEDVFA